MGNNIPQILVIDDEESLRYTFRSFLAKEGYAVDTASSFREAVECIEKAEENAFDVIFADIILPGNQTGIDLLRHIREKEISTPVVMITGQPEIDTAAEAVRQGAFDYVPKPVRRETLLRLAKTAITVGTLEREKKQAQREEENVRQHLAAVFRSVDEAIITVDDHMRVLSANSAVTDICGLSPENLSGKVLDAAGCRCLEKCAGIAVKTLETGKFFRDIRIECPKSLNLTRIVSVNSTPLMTGEANQTGAVLVLRDITRMDRLERKLAERTGFGGIIGKSESMQQIYTLLENLSDLDTTVLVTGESGTGKELVARALHAGSRRAGGPLIKVNCAALSESLLESELFGHVKGAFTGAQKDRPGRFEMADGGTIFLDEIGDISPAVQSKLLRVLQEREIERVGDSKTRRVDVRVISATNCDLTEKIQQGQFREDLYYRLKVMEIRIPPLRERKQDIPLLMEHFRKDLNHSMGRSFEGISEDAMAACLRYDWPGNVRELKHCMEHAFVLCKDAHIRMADLPAEILAPAEDQPGTMKDDGPGASARNGGTDRRAVEDALEKSGWNKAGAARLLNVSRQTIYRKIREYGISDSSDSQSQC